jgi:hypothetical protein
MASSQKGNETALIYGVKAIPMNLLINDKGIIVAKSFFYYLQRPGIYLSVIIIFAWQLCRKNSSSTPISWTLP